MNCGCGTGGCRNEHGYYGNSEYWVDMQDGYARIIATCKIPPTIPPGVYNLQAIPTIYSSPTTLTPASTTFKIAPPLEKLFASLQTAIENIFRSLTSFFILK